MVNIVRPASCLDADRAFGSEALNTDQISVKKKKKKTTNLENLLG